MRMNGAPLQSFPFVAVYTGLAKNADEQAGTDVLTMGIRNAELDSASFHELVTTAGYRRLKTESAETGNEILALRWPDRRHQAT